MKQKTNNNLTNFGKITKTHGIKGELRLLPLFDDCAFFFSVKNVALFRNDTFVNSFVITEVRAHKQFLLIKLQTLDNINDVEQFVGMDVFVKTDEVPQTKENEYYIRDLIGLQAYDNVGTYLGELKQVYKTGSQDVYEVCNPTENNEILVPATAEYILKVDIAKKKITIKKPQYL